MEDMLRIERWYLDPKNHDEAVKIAGKLLKHAAGAVRLAVHQEGLLPRSGHDAGPRGAAAQRRHRRETWASSSRSVDVKEHSDLSLIEEAAKRLKCCGAAALRQRLTCPASRIIFRIASASRRMRLRRCIGQARWSAGRRWALRHWARAPGSGDPWLQGTRRGRASWSSSDRLRGLVSPWRLPALHPPFRGEGKWDKDAPRVLNNRGASARRKFPAAVHNGCACKPSTPTS